MTGVAAIAAAALVVHCIEQRDRLPGPQPSPPGSPAHPPATSGLHLPLPCCSYTNFGGCGGQGYWDVTTIEFKNSASSTQTVCLDGIRLLSSSTSR